MTKKRKFGVRLIIYFMCVVLITLLNAAFCMKNRTEAILEENAKLTSEQTINTALEEFDKYMKILSLPIDLNCRKNDFKKIDQNYSEDSIKAIEDSLLSALKVIEHSERAYYSTASGIYISAKLKISEEGKKTGDYIVEEGINNSNQEWYANSIGLGNRKSVFSYFSKPYVNEEGITVITVSQNLKASEEHVGVVAMDINVEAFQEYIDSIQLMNTGFTALVDENGSLIFVDSEYADTINKDLPSLFNWDKLVASANQYAEKTMEETEEEVAPKASMTTKIGSKEYYVTTVQDSITGWYLVGFVGSNETASSISKILQATNVAIMISLAIAIIAAFLISKHIADELKKVCSVSSVIASGDLTGRLAAKRSDEFGEVEKNFNIMSENLTSLITEVNNRATEIDIVAKNVLENSNETKDITSQVTESIFSVAEGSSKQVVATKDATNKVAELAENLESSNDKVNIIELHSKETKNLSDKGNGILSELSSKSEQAKKNAQTSVDTMAEMLKALDKINYISDAIADITDQTNLLSLNASIEAARAGEAGKGFSVVADEIRKLADESNHSTEEIKTILAEIHINSSLVDASLKDTEEIQDEQQKTIMETQEVFSKITESIEELEQEIEEIATINETMQLIRDDVIHKMDTIMSITESSAAESNKVNESADQVNNTMQKVADQASELANIVEILHDTIHKFKF